MLILTNLQYISILSRSLSKTKDLSLWALTPGLVEQTMISVLSTCSYLSPPSIYMYFLFFIISLLGVWTWIHHPPWSLSKVGEHAAKSHRNAWAEINPPELEPWFLIGRGRRGWNGDSYCMCAFTFALSVCVCGFNSMTWTWEEIETQEQRQRVFWIHRIMLCVKENWSSDFQKRYEI